LEIIGIESNVWKKIAENINNKYKEQQTPGSIRIRVALNRGGIKQKLSLADLAAPAVKNVEKVHRVSGRYYLPILIIIY
jgi:hypothetical protein